MIPPRPRALVIVLAATLVVAPAHAEDDSPGFLGRASASIGQRWNDLRRWIADWIAPDDPTCPKPAEDLRPVEPVLPDPAPVEPEVADPIDEPGSGILGQGTRSVDDSPRPTGAVELPLGEIPLPVFRPDRPEDATRGGTALDETADLPLLQEGVASWYGPGFDGRKTATGEIFRENEVSAAMFKDRNGRAIRKPLRVRVECVGKAPSSTLPGDPCKKRFLDLRVNDAGPFKVTAGGRLVRPLQQHPTRVIDLSKKAMMELVGTSGGRPLHGLVSVKVYRLE